MSDQPTTTTTFVPPAGTPTYTIVLPARPEGPTWGTLPPYNPCDHFDARDACAASVTDPCGDYSTKEACATYQAARPPLAEGCRNEQYQDGTSEVICDTNGALPAAVPVVGVAKQQGAALPATGTPAGLLTLLALSLIILGKGLAKVKR